MIINLMATAILDNIMKKKYEWLVIDKLVNFIITTTYYNNNI